LILLLRQIPPLLDNIADILGDPREIWNMYITSAMQQVTALFIVLAEVSPTCLMALPIRWAGDYRELVKSSFLDLQMSLEVIHGENACQ